MNGEFGWLLDFDRNTKQFGMLFFDQMSVILSVIAPLWTFFDSSIA